MAQFTIGIPTYNRAQLLQEALASATPQLDGGVEVVVVNNGSTDSTREVLARTPDNVRAFHHPNNLGAHFSFTQTLEHSNTEFFSWLQDDDLLNGDFLKRARNGFRLYPEASVYIAYSAHTSARRNLVDAKLQGPPIALDSFAGKEMQLVDAPGLIALSFFCSAGNPPVVVYRRESLVKAMDSWDSRFPLYVERTLLNAVLRDGPAIVDASVGGIFFCHPGQEYRRLWKMNDSRRSDWLDMALKASSHLAECRDWKNSVERMTDHLSSNTIGEWLKYVGNFGDEIPECRYVINVLNAKLERSKGDAPAESVGPNSLLKGCLRQLVPPVFWEAAAAAKRLALGCKKKSPRRL